MIRVTISQSGPIRAVVSSGVPGKSAYQTWLGLGNDGTEEDFLATLQGEAGTADALTVAFDDALTSLDAENVQTAIVNMFDLITAGGTGDLDFTNPNNSALIGAF